MTNTNPARGMRDFLPAQIRRREYVIGIIKEVYESYGFEPLETPAVENLETLTGKYGEEGNQLIYKILKRGEKLEQSRSENELSDLALRYDLTVPLARVVANHKNDLPKLFKRYQIQPVWRADRPARGRYREFYQCDVDAIGSSSMIVEAELCAAVSEIMERLGFDNFVIRVNHRKLLVELLDAAGVSSDKYIDALVALDKLDKIGREGVTKEFLQRGVSQNSAEKLLVFFESLVESDIKNVLGKSSTKKLIELQKQITEKEKAISDAREKAEVGYKLSLDLRSETEKLVKKLSEENSPINTDNLQKSTSIIVESTKQIKQLVNYMRNLTMLKGLLGFLLKNTDDEDYNSEGISSLTKFFSTFESTHITTKSLILEPASERIIIDPSLARGLSYYTGAIFEINVPDLAGSLGGGGRYDGLIGMFGKEQIPACGFSLGLERILVVMEERGMFPKELETNSADVLITIWNEESIGESLKLAGELRQRELRVLVYPEADKLGKQFKYADSIKIPFVCVLGETELAENKVTLKNMRTGEQETVLREDVVSKLKDLPLQNK
ncbi:MAG: histidine--tRNA ligase [Acidobacteriota bacterium]|nr:histidine--tRNA ligase [Acidobacteriota bacterium]